MGLAEALTIPAISTGDMLREAVAAGTDLGKQVQTVMESGELVSDDLMAEVVRERLSQDDAAEGFLLDGYPRTESQARTLDQILIGSESELDHVVFLDVWISWPRQTTTPALRTARMLPTSTSLSSGSTSSTELATKVPLSSTAPFTSTQ